MSKSIDFNFQLPKPTPNIGLDLICCKTSETLFKDRVVTGEQNWDEYTEKEVANWDKHQDEWLSNFIPGAFFALEGDLVKPYFRAVIDSDTPVPKRTQQKLQITVRTLKNTLKNIELIRGTNDQQSFEKLIADLRSVIESLNASRQFKVNFESDMTYKKFIYLANVVSERETWQAVESFLEMTGDFEPKRALKNLNKFNKDLIYDLDKLLKAWREIYDQTYQRLQNENDRQGNAERDNKKAEVQIKIDQCNSVLNDIKESLHV